MLKRHKLWMASFAILAALVFGYPAVAQWSNTGAWDTITQFLGKAHTWTGTQTFIGDVTLDGEGSTHKIVFKSGATTELEIGVVSTGKAFIANKQDKDMAFETNSAERLLLKNNGNIGFNNSSFGTSAVKVLGIGTGTAPTTSPADMMQAWTADQEGTAGEAALHVRSEGGGVTTIGGDGGNGQQLNLDSATTELTGITGATVTATNLIPAGSLVVGVTIYVTTEIEGGTDFDIGDGTDPDAWGNGIAYAAGTASTIADFTVTTPAFYGSATSVVLTQQGAGNFTAGACRITVHFISLTAATS